MKSTSILDVIQAHVQAGQEERSEWDKYHAWYLSEYWGQTRTAHTGLYGEQGSDSEINMETNYPYAYIDTMIANICPTNPMVTVNARNPRMDSIARARSNLINDEMRRDKMHAKAWDISTFSAICGRGVSKTVWNTNTRRPECSIVDPKRFFFDMSVPFEKTRYVFEATLLTREEFAKRIKKGRRGGPKYNQAVASKVSYGAIPKWLEDATNHRGRLGDHGREAFEWCEIYEFYDLQEQKYYHFVPGSKEPLLEGELPFKYMTNPFSLVTFNRTLRDFGGIPDIKLIAPIQEQLNEIDSLELLFAYTCIPVMVVNEGELDSPEEFVESLRNATGPGAIARLKGKQKVPLQNIISYTPTPSITPSFDKMRQRCVQLIEFTLGIPQYSRGVVGVADVATELALADTATRTRNGRRIKVIEDWISDVGKKYIALWKQFIEADEEVAVRVVGTPESEVLNPDKLGMSPFGDGEAFEKEWYFDYEAVPYSPTENHRLVQLQKLQQFAQLIVGNPHVDQTKLMGKLLDLLGMVELQSKTPPGTPITPGGAPMQAGGRANMLPQGPQDTVVTGGLPPGTGTDAVAVPGAGAMAAQPAVKM